MAKASVEAADVRWDLSIFYSHLDNPDLDSDVGKLETLAARFSLTYKGHLAQLLGAAIRDYSEIEMLASKIAAYLSLLESADLGNPAIKAKHSDIQRKLSDFAGRIPHVFEIELAQLTGSDLVRWYENDATVADHRPWIERIRLFKPHFLSEPPVESALTKRSPFGSEAWSEFFDEVEADLEFVQFRGEVISVKQLVHVLSDSKDAAERAEAMAYPQCRARWPVCKVCGTNSLRRHGVQVHSKTGNVAMRTRWIVAIK